MTARAGVVLATLLAACATTPGAPPLPLPSGTYEFRHRYAEHPDIPSLVLQARIDGRRIVLVNPVAADPFPAGVLAEGELAWHAASSQWIIVSSPEDAAATDVGGCSDGPEVVDLVARVYWTC